MPPRFPLARRRAAELLTEGQIKKAPIPVERFTVRYEPFAGDQLSGMVHRRKDGRAVIGVNSLDAPTRRRFTIAHEIGHLVLHKNEQFHVDEKFPIGLRNELSSLAVDEKEIEANQFAAELLMPSHLIAKDIEELPADIEADDVISRLARRYQVSIQAMTIRLSTLGILAFNANG